VRENDVEKVLMLPTAKDLPAEVKREILHQIRENLGFDAYNNLFAELGEDGLLDVALSQMYAKNNASTRSKPSKTTRPQLKGAGYVFYIALFLAMLAGAYYPDGNIFSQYYDKLFPFAGCIVGIGVLIIWATSGINLSDSVYLWAVIAATIVTSIVGMIVNIWATGIVVIGVGIVALIYCFVLGIILGVPAYVLIKSIESEFLRGVGWIAAFIVAVIVLGVGWQYIIMPLFA
jgi:hypothetical protein